LHSTHWNSDSPWNRLPWTLPVALLIWAAALWALAFFMGKPSSRPVDQAPIDAQFIEQFMPVATEDIGPGRAAGAPDTSQPESRTEPQPAPKPENNIKEQHRKPVVKPPAHIARQHPKPVVRPSANAAAPAATDAGPPREEQGGAVGEPSANIGAQGGSPYGKGTSTGSMYANSGARAILKPLPQIPDDLRRDAFNSSVLARFHVGADGSAEVELTQSTLNVRLNRIVMETLKKWRFMPAIKNGKPVASVEEILVKIEVK